MVNVVLAGGGTAGHTSPLIATAQALLADRPDTNLVCVGTARGLETTVIPDAGLRLELIPPVPLPRTVSGELFKVPARLRRAVKAARDVVVEARADVVVGFGGYVSMPVYLAARRLRVPIVIHEQNAVPGLANRVASRFAHDVATAFPGTPLRHAVHVGMPLRRDIVQLAGNRGEGQERAREAFGLAPDLPTLLVSGGSQGARSINQATVAARDELLRLGVQVLHVWGPKNFTDDLEAVTDDSTGARYVPVRYVDAMSDAYRAADLMLGRAGAGTVTETAAVGLPLVAVPLPIGNGEQAKNAAPLVEAGAQIVIDDSNLTPERLMGEVADLARDPDRLEVMAAVGKQLIPADAAAIFARTIWQAAGEPI